ncbi:hypothetical protein EON63_23020, partial [archaeon]
MMHARYNPKHMHNVARASLRGSVGGVEFTTQAMLRGSTTAAAGMDLGGELPPIPQRRAPST